MTTNEWDEIFPAVPEDVKKELANKIMDMWIEMGGDAKQLIKLIKDDIGHISDNK